MYLFISYDIPGLGGAATNIYEIFNYWKDKYPCCVLFISESTMFNSNNNKIFVTNQENLHENITKILKILNNYENVTIIFKIYSVFNSVITKYFTQSNIKKKIYLCSGLKTINKLVQNNVNIYKKTDSIKIEEKDFIPINETDVTVVNSNLTYKFLKNMHHNNKIKIINTSIIFKNINLNTEFKYDIIFSSSSYRRIVKNPDLAIRLFSYSRMHHLKKVIIGSNFPNYIKNIPNMIYIDKNIDNNAFIQLLRNTKILFLPSFYDSMPNILYEAICNGVTPVISNKVECTILPNRLFFDINSKLQIIANLISDALLNPLVINERELLDYKNKELLKLENVIKHCS
jgi:hypothetical protein